MCVPDLLHACSQEGGSTSCVHRLSWDIEVSGSTRHPPGDTEALHQADLPSVHTVLMMSQLRWAGHVDRMPDHQLSKTLLYGALQRGKRFHGGRKKHFNDTLKTSLKAFNISRDIGTHCYGSNWMALLYPQSRQFTLKKKRSAAAQQKKQAKKAHANNQGQVSHIPYSSCHRTFRACVGLISPLRVHKSSLAPLISKVTEVVLVESTDEREEPGEVRTRTYT